MSSRQGMLHSCAWRMESVQRWVSTTQIQLFNPINSHLSSANSQTVSIDFLLICTPEILRMCGSLTASLAAIRRLMLSMDVLSKQKTSFSLIPTKKPSRCCCGLWQSTLFFANMQCIPGVKISSFRETGSFSTYVWRKMILPTAQEILTFYIRKKDRL